MVLPSLLVLLVATAGAPSRAAAPQPSATPPPIVPAPASDSAPDTVTQLANAMNLALPEKERLAAVSALGRLGDQRLIPVLSYLMLDRSRPVRDAAVAAVGAMQSDAAQELLVGCARNTSLAFDTREACVRTLHVQGLPSAPERLEQLSKDSSLTGALVTLARSELQAHYPSRLQTVPEQASPAAARATASRFSFQVSGRQALMVAGATYGGYSLYALGDVGRTDAGPALGLIGGAALGGAAGYLVGKDFTQARSLTLAAGTGLGLWTGLGVGLATLSPTADRRNLHFFALGGELLGAATTWASWDSLAPLVEPSPQADPWITPTAILLTTPALHLVSQINNDDGTLQALGLTSGIVLGGTAGMLLKNRVTDGRGSYLLTGTGWSMGLGALTLLTLNDDPLLHQTELAMLGAGLAGLGLSHLTWTPGLKTGDVTTINGFAAGGAAFGAGLIFTGPEDGKASTAAGVLAASTAAGLAGGRLLTQHLQFSRGDSGLLGLGLGHGALTGFLLPGAAKPEPSSSARLAGTLLGGSLGSLAAVGLTQVTDYTPAEVGRMFLFDAFSSMAGLGAVQVVRSRDTTAQDRDRGLLVGGLVGLAAASQLAPRMELSRGDNALMGLGTGWGAWQGLGLAVGLDAPGEVVGGATLLGLGVGGLSGMALSQNVDLSPGWVAAASTGALWGGWLMTSAQLAWGELDQSDMLLVLGASDLGMAVSTLALSPVVEATPTQVGITGLGGLGGGVLFTLGAGLFTRDSRDLLRAGFVGTSVGLLAGGLFASQSSPVEDKATSGAVSSSGGSAGIPSVSFRGLSTAPLFTADGRSRGMAVVASFEND